MEREARNWKWMVPGAFCAVSFLLMRWMLMTEYSWMQWSSIVAGFVALMCAIAAIGNLIDYRRAQEVSMLERRRNAMSRTPISAQLEAARGVHPDIAKMLMNERNRVWMLKSGVKADGIIPHSVLYGAPNVTDIFLKYFLESSTDTTVMPKRVLVDGRKNRFDPWGAVTEYQMYDALIQLLAAQGKIHKWSEFSMWEWLDPWTPALVADDFGLEFEDVSSVPEDAAVKK